MNWIMKFVSMPSSAWNTENRTDWILENWTECTSIAHSLIFICVKLNVASTLGSIASISINCLLLQSAVAFMSTTAKAGHHFLSKQVKLSIHYYVYSLILEQQQICYRQVKSCYYISTRLYILYNRITFFNTMNNHLHLFSHFLTFH